MEAHNCLYKRVEKLRTTHATYKVVRASVIHLIHKEKTAPEGRENFLDPFRGFRGPPVWRRGRVGPTDPPRTRNLGRSIFADASPQRRTAFELASISRPECLQPLGNEARCKRNEKISPAAPSIGVFPYPGDNVDRRIGLKRVQILHDLLSNSNGSGQTVIFTITPMVNGRDAFRSKCFIDALRSPPRVSLLWLVF